MELSDEEVGNDRNSDNEGGYRSDEAQEDPGGQEEDGEGGKGRRIDPTTSKKKVVRNPQPKLNAERIQGSKGVQTIEKYFEGFKFHGKGHEKADLDRVMKRLEHWAHRLFPKYRFDDFVEKMEVLGSKKNVQVFLKKYRLDMIKPDDDIIDLDEENEAKEAENVPEEAPIDEFDKLIAEQIEKQRKVTNETPKQINKPTGHVLGTASTAKPIEMTEEVRARIEANRKLAMERKMARLRREEESRKRKLEESLPDNQTSKSIEVSVTIESNKSVEETTKKVSPAKEKVLEEVTGGKVHDEPEDFGRRENYVNADEDAKRRKAQEAKETFIVDAEKEPEKIQEPMDVQSLPGDLPSSRGEKNHDAVAKDIAEVATHQFQDSVLPEVNGQDCGESKEESKKVLTHEELMMQIDGAMEEIINKSTRRST